MGLGLTRDQAIVGGKYVLAERLGEGGMAEVWLARNTKICQTVALKFPKGWAKASPRDRRRFLREAQLAVRHDHIVYIHDVEDLNENIPFLVMEQLTGRTLRTELLEKGALQFERAVNILLQVTSAVGTMHANHVVHRDLKPDNIFLLDKGAGRDFAKVLDFGIAKSLGEPLGAGEVDPTRTQGALGTRGYMAPEQLRSARTVGREADIWSLGIMLFECLCGAHPWLRRKAGGVEVDSKARELFEADTAYLVDSRIPSLPSALREALLGALQPDPAKRPLVGGFFGALAHHATVEVPAVPSPRATPLQTGSIPAGTRLEGSTWDVAADGRMTATTRTRPGGAMGMVRESARDPEHGLAGPDAAVRQPSATASSGALRIHARLVAAVGGIFAAVAGFGAVTRDLTSERVTTGGMSRVEAHALPQEPTVFASASLPPAPAPSPSPHEGSVVTPPPAPPLGPTTKPAAQKRRAALAGDGSPVLAPPSANSTSTPASAPVLVWVAPSAEPSAVARSVSFEEAPPSAIRAYKDAGAPF